MTSHNAHEKIGVEPGDVIGDAAQGIRWIYIQKSGNVTGQQVQVDQGHLGVFRCKPGSQVHRYCCYSRTTGRIIDSSDLSRLCFGRRFCEPKPAHFRQCLDQLLLSDGAQQVFDGTGPHQLQNPSRAFFKRADDY